MTLLRVAGTATEARDAALPARHTAGARELSSGAATDARDAAVAARAAAGAPVRAADTAVAVDVAAFAARVILDDYVRCRRVEQRWSTRKNIRRGGWCDGDRRSYSPSYHQWFHEV